MIDVLEIYFLLILFFLLQTFFLVNENNSQLDTLLKNDLCTVLQDILEHGLTSQRKDVSSAKQVNLWKIIEKSIDHGKICICS